jgi:DNA-binding NarL/FixJ family response regulator
MAQPLRARSPHDHWDDHPRTLVLVDAIDEKPERRADEIRVLIACGDVLARAGLHALLELESDIAVVGSAADGQEVVALAGQIRPDVVLLDTTLPGAEVVEVARQIMADPDTSEVSLLILSASERDEEVFSSLRAGASGFLLRDSDPAALIHAVRIVAGGEAALAPSVVRRVIAEFASQPYPRLPSPQLLDELTPREREVMALVASGLSNDEIAEHLVISRATAKTHVSRALRKLHARDRAQLVTLAYQTGLVVPRQPAAATFAVPAPTYAAA